MYQILASDLDGTLLNHNSEISSENLLAIQQFVEKGGYFVPSSGRTLSEISEELRCNPYIRYIIHSNGATVHDLKTGDSILMCVEKEDAARMLDILYSYNIHLTVRQGGRCYMDAEFQNEEAYSYYNVWEVHKEVITKYGEAQTGFKEFVYTLDNIEMVSVFFHSDEELEVCRKRLLDTGVLRVAEGWLHNLEICSVQAGKGKALLRLADLLQVAHEDTIAVGDSDNDTTMIEAAGLGLAVSNACDKLKEQADRVICSNEEHAIAYIVSHISG